MSIRASVRSLTLPALLISAAVAVAWANPLQRPEGGRPPQREGGGELEHVMESIDKNFEAVLQSIEKKDAAAALELVSKIQSGVLEAKTMLPPKLRIIEEKDQAAFKAGYRKELMVLLKLTADLDIALVDGDLEKAKTVAEQMDAQKKASHEVYKKMPRKQK